MWTGSGLLRPEPVRRRTTFEFGVMVPCLMKWWRPATVIAEPGWMKKPSFRAKSFWASRILRSERERRWPFDCLMAARAASHSVGLPTSMAWASVWGFWGWMQLPLWLAMGSAPLAWRPMREGSLRIKPAYYFLAIFLYLVSNLSTLVKIDVAYFIHLSAIS